MATPITVLDSANIAVTDNQYIVSITEWVGKLIHEGKTGTQIIDINGNKYIDERSYNDFIKYLSITKPFV